MAAGSLVGDDLVEGVVGVRLREHDWNYGFIIDGFPRSERRRFVSRFSETDTVNPAIAL